MLCLQVTDLREDVIEIGCLELTHVQQRVPLLLMYTCQEDGHD